ncbi:hypothetical protein PINS_up015560 [Pythium insidiosum]|nr:hypothetical protein PINS_up015560 [Pythium insidiosum]
MAQEATCSATATTAWKAKCPSRTAGNRDFLPLTDMKSGEINVDDATLADTYRQARLTALKLSGAAGNAAMAGMRQKTRAWYEQSLRKMLTFFCVATSDDQDLQRCVAPTNPLADKNANGECVVVNDADSCQKAGQCERVSNCKWDDIPTNATSRRQLFTDADVTTARKWMEREYPKTFAGFLAPGIVFAVLTAVSCVAFVVLRCVFNQCGGRNPTDKGYTRCDILIPAVIFTVCTVAVFICSFITVAQNTNISEGVGGVLNSLNVTLGNIGIFATNVNNPLALAEKQLQVTKASVGIVTKDTEWIKTDAQTLRQMVLDFSSYFGAQGPFPTKGCDASSNPACITCPDAVCGAPLKAFTQQILALVDGASVPMAGAIETMQTSFVNKSDTISLRLRDASIEIKELAVLAKSSQEVVGVIKETFDDYSFSRSALVMSVFIFGVMASLVGMFAIFKGVCKRKSGWVQLLHVSWIVGVLVCILGFVLSSSLLAVGALWFDSCNYMNILHADLRPYFPSRISSIMNACFEDNSILKPLDLDDVLSFQCNLDDQYTAASKADLSAANKLIQTYGVKVSDYGLRDFGFDSSLLRDLLSKANSGASDVGRPGKAPFTQDNIARPWLLYDQTSSDFGCGAKNITTDELPICFMAGKCASGNGPTSGKDKCKDAYTHAYSYVLSFTKISSMLDEMRQDLLGDTVGSFSATWKHSMAIADFAKSYFERLASARTRTVDYLMKGDVGRVVEAIERVRCTESCGWINISFNAVHDSLCKDILGTTLAIALCVLFLCIFLIPMIVTGITLQKRLRGVKKGTYEELEKRLHALENKQREEARAKANGAKKSGGIDLFKFKRTMDSA